MKETIRFAILGFFLLNLFFSHAQVSSLNLDPEKEKQFTPYMMYRHGGPDGLKEFKEKHRYAYLKELWYYSESFYVRHGVASEGADLDPSVIDISRFESHRKADVESVVIMPGFKDALVLLPLNKLIYKPE